MDVKGSRGGSTSWTSATRRGKSVKTASLRRRVPIHPELERLGFLDYVEGGSAPGRAIPILQQNSYWKVDAELVKWWGHYARGAKRRDSGSAQGRPTRSSGTPSRTACRACSIPRGNQRCSRGAVVAASGARTAGDTRSRSRWRRRSKELQLRTDCDLGNGFRLVCNHEHEQCTQSHPR